MWIHLDFTGSILPQVLGMTLGIAAGALTGFAIAKTPTGALIGAAGALANYTIGIGAVAIIAYFKRQ